MVKEFQGAVSSIQQIMDNLFTAMKVEKRKFKFLSEE